MLIRLVCLLTFLIYNAADELLPRTLVLFYYYSD